MNSDNNWSIDRRFDLKIGDRLGVLQRSLVDVCSAMNLELLPFKNERFVVQYRESGLASGPEAAHKLMMSRDQDAIQCGINIGHRRKVFRLRSPVENRLTVWRLNDALEALQFNLISGDNSIYLQIGGELLAELFVNAALEGYTEPDLDWAAKVFEFNALGRAEEIE